MSGDEQFDCVRCHLNDKETRPLKADESPSIALSTKHEHYRSISRRTVTSLSLGIILGPRVTFEVVARHDLRSLLDYRAFDIPPSHLQRSSKNVTGLKQSGKILKLRASIGANYTEHITELVSTYFSHESQPCQLLRALRLGGTILIVIQVCRLYVYIYIYIYI